MRAYWFPLLIALLSTGIFYLSPSLSETVRPGQTLKQDFVEARVLDVLSSELAPDPRAPGIFTGNQQLRVEILEGIERGNIVEVFNPVSRQHNVQVQTGDHFILMIRHSNTNGKVYWVYNHKRSTAIYAMAAVFLLLLLSLGRREGLNSVISLYFTAALIIGVLMPALFAGWHPVPITTLLMALMISVNFLLVAGNNRKSYCAMLGTLLGVVAAGVMMQLFGSWAELSGIYLEHGEDVIYLAKRPLPVQWLMFVAIMIAALGAVMDVAISIAAAYQELQQTDPSLSPKQLRRSCMNIGRDIMGTMTNTLILAFAGGSLTLIMMVWGFAMPLTQLLNMPVIALALVNAIAGSVGIVLTIPLTAWLASVIFPVTGFAGKTELAYRNEPNANRGDNFPVTSVE